MIRITCFAVMPQQGCVMAGEKYQAMEVPGAGCLGSLHMPLYARWIMWGLFPAQGINSVIFQHRYKSFRVQTVLFSCSTLPCTKPLREWLRE